MASRLLGQPPLNPRACDGKEKKYFYAVYESRVVGFFLGVRKKSGLQEDIATLSFVHIIIAGVVGALIFMAILLLVVKAVVSH